MLIITLKIIIGIFGWFMSITGVIVYTNNGDKHNSDSKTLLLLGFVLILLLAVS